MPVAIDLVQVRGLELRGDWCAHEVLSGRLQRDLPEESSQFGTRRPTKLDKIEIGANWDAVKRTHRLR